MTLLNQQQCNYAREKRRTLQEEYDAVRTDPVEDERVRALTLRSLKRLINQLTEEIARFEARAGTGIEAPR